MGAIASGHITIKKLGSGTVQYSIPSGQTTTTISNSINSNPKIDNFASGIEYIIVGPSTQLQLSDGKNNASIQFPDNKCHKIVPSTFSVKNINFSNLTSITINTISKDLVTLCESDTATLQPEPFRSTQMGKRCSNQNERPYILEKYIELCSNKCFQYSVFFLIIVFVMFYFYTNK
jgi:hypothetical protein